MTGTAPDKPLRESIESGLRKILNRHGHGFHYAVLERGAALLNEQRSKWIFQAAEFPVAVRGMTTKIDFVLEHRDEPRFLIAECKRANPAYLNWCFVRSPYTRRDPRDGELLVEHVVREGDNQVYAGKSALGHVRSLYFGLGVELKSGEKGDPGGPGKGGIEDAAGQVCLGVSGFIDFLSRHGRLLQERTKFQLIPVIFTTARIWTSDVDLSAADLSTGQLGPEELNPTRADWIWLRYHISPDVRHETRPAGAASSLGNALDFEYTRSIAVVSAEGIDAFLSHEW